MTAKGKWAQGITPRNFAWVINDRFAVCERPGGHGQNHRRVRRQEEIIWVREQGFTCVISLIPSPHNLHNYDELDVVWRHRPFLRTESERQQLAALFAEFDELLDSGEKLLVHKDELADEVGGIVGGFLLWRGLIDHGPEAVSVIEQITGRRLGPLGRRLVSTAGELRKAR